MSATRTPIGFSLDALLTRVIPGLIVIFPWAIDLWLIAPELYEDTTTVLFAIAMGALVIGELVEHVRSGLFRVPLPFAYAMYKETGDESDLPGLFRYRLKLDRLLPSRFSLVTDFPEDVRLDSRLDHNFFKEMEEAFDLDSSRARSRDFFDTLVLYIGNEQSERTRRYRNMYIFTQNLKMSSLVSIIVFLYFIVLRYPDASYLVLGIPAIGLMVVSLVLWGFLGASPNLYMEMLEKEFYVKLQTR